MNDFLQLSKILERLKESDEEAFNTMFCLFEEKLKLEEELKERGKRFAKLQTNRKHSTVGCFFYVTVVNTSLYLYLQMQSYQHLWI